MKQLVAYIFLHKTKDSGVMESYGDVGAKKAMQSP